MPSCSINFCKRLCLVQGARKSIENEPSSTVQAARRSRMIPKLSYPARVRPGACARPPRGSPGSARSLFGCRRSGRRPRWRDGKRGVGGSAVRPACPCPLRERRGARVAREPGLLLERTYRGRKARPARDCGLAYDSQPLPKCKCRATFATVTAVTPKWVSKH